MPFDLSILCAEHSFWACSCRFLVRPPTSAISAKGPPRAGPKVHFRTGLGEAANLVSAAGPRSAHGKGISRLETAGTWARYLARIWPQRRRCVGIGGRQPRVFTRVSLEQAESRISTGTGWWSRGGSNP